jgi:hypothetical protein
MIDSFLEPTSSDGSVDFTRKGALIQIINFAKHSSLIHGQQVIHFLLANGFFDPASLEKQMKGNGYKIPNPPLSETIQAETQSKLLELLAFQTSEAEKKKEGEIIIVENRL